jgi:hypothetical protein
MIEEANVVIGFFDRFYLLRNELVELGKIGNEVSGQSKIQGNSPGTVFLSIARPRQTPAPSD